MKAGNLKRALAKIFIVDASAMRFGIYCTAAEFKALNIRESATVQPEIGHGIGGQSWHYFTLPKKRGQTAEQVLADFRFKQKGNKNAD